MIINIEKEITERFKSDEIINLYDFLGSCKQKFKLLKIFFLSKYSNLIKT
jgi:hypothetical protein